MPGVYGGDDVSAIVIDAGSSTMRFGWAGDDAPRAVVPSTYSWLPDPNEERQASPKSAADGDAMDVDAADASNGNATGNGHVNGGAPLINGKRKQLPDKYSLDKGQRRRRFVGEASNAWREGAEVDTPFTDGTLASPAAYLAIAQHALTGLMGADVSEHPLLLSEPAWATKESREEMIELAFEALDAPAFYLANSTVLSSFAAGKPTSLVLDVGATHASAIPVVDGFVLRKGVRRSAGLGGDAVSRALLYDLSTSAPQQTPRAGGLVNIVPQYLVRSKTVVGPGKASQAILRERPASESYRHLTDYRVLHEAKETLAQVLEMGWDDGQASIRPNRPFEFPDGYVDTFGIERFRAPEVMFSPQKLWGDKPGVLPAPTAGTSSLLSIPQLVLDAINSTDVDSRPALFGNVVCVGGGSCIPGFNDRLSYELSVAAPSQKIKIHSPGNTVERRFSSWLGGSILASLGTFHQLWISKQEYEEHGAAIVHSRCR
ncbi:Actin/actin-like protein [Ceraceosorus guamensis]|uniref:Actin/actin-like protein n=1 Tax=Ceraceosorus guamensis TaxID=1522189 RepID=A0A316VWR8_9BASI|nr:Actin/actin-like protein [Ceraceosorus guamensis]PWN41398.1 Actin/actin-like protein [Ceraceosorus guamensis]